MDAGRMVAPGGLPPALVERSALTAVVLGSSLRSVMSARVQLPGLRESARAGLSWTRAHARELGIPREVFEKNTLHIHVPAGAIPKDGPSAGITMALAIVSALTGIPVLANVDVGHTNPLATLPIGGHLELHASNTAATHLTITRPGGRPSFVAPVPPSERETSCGTAQ